ncbi:sugar phosphate isomerase/epimerase [bacterium]|nr:sugar phosphate isomerase/epimerase [bacterium]
MKTYKIGSGFSPFSPCVERFVTDGYREKVSLVEQIQMAGKIEGLLGIALDYPYQFVKEDIPDIKSACEKEGKVLCTVEAGIYPDKRWKQGSISSPDLGIRRESIRVLKETIDVSVLMGAESVLIWPGQDGFDYPFQADYKKSWGYIVESLQEIGEYRKDVKIGIEYKPKEPRTNLFIRNVGILLYLLKSIDLPNVGGVVDYGHSLVAGENPAESVVLLANEDKLFEVHLNDNYRDFDHDLIVGSVSFWETLEFCYWLDVCNYDGWYLMDVFPYRENGVKALECSVNNTINFIKLAKELRSSNLEHCLQKRDIVSVLSILNERILK